MGSKGTDGVSPREHGTALELICDFLMVQGHLEALRAMERDLACCGGMKWNCFGEDVDFVRELLLDGEFADVERALAAFEVPGEGPALFDTKSALWAVRKQRLLEMTEKDPPAQPKSMGNLFVSIEGLNIGEQEELKVLKEALTKLDAKIYDPNFNVMRGRYACFDFLLNECGLVNFVDTNSKPVMQIVSRMAYRPQLYEVLRRAEYLGGDTFDAQGYQRRAKPAASVPKLGKEIARNRENVMRDNDASFEKEGKKKAVAFDVLFDNKQLKNLGSKVPESILSGDENHSPVVQKSKPRFPLVGMDETESQMNQKIEELSKELEKMKAQFLVSQKDQDKEVKAEHKDAEEELFDVFAGGDEFVPQDEINESEFDAGEAGDEDMPPPSSQMTPSGESHAFAKDVDPIHAESLPPPNVYNARSSIEEMEREEKSVQDDANVVENKERITLADARNVHPCACMLEDFQPIRTSCFSPNGDRVALGTNSRALVTIQTPVDIAKLISRAPKLVPIVTTSTGIEEYSYEAYMDTPRLRLASLKHRQKDVHVGSVYCLDWFGDVIATGSNDKAINVWKYRNDKLRPFGEPLLGHRSTVRNLKFFEDGKLISVGGGDNAARLWDPAFGGQIDLFQGHDAGVFGLDVVEEKQFVTSSQDGSIRFWDARTGGSSAIAELVSKTAPQKPVHAVASCPGRTFLIAAGNEDGQCCLWDLRKGQCLAEIAAHSDEIRSLAFSQNGNFLLTGSFDGSVALIDSSSSVSLEIAARYLAHDDKVLSVKWHPNKDLFVSTSVDRTCKIWAF